MAPQKANTGRTKSRNRASALAKAFQMADKDQNGCLNEEEFIKVWRDQGVNFSEEAGSAFFREKDKDMDGRISYEEFIGEARQILFTSSKTNQSFLRTFFSLPKWRKCGVPLIKTKMALSIRMMLV